MNRSAFYYQTHVVVVHHREAVSFDKRIFKVKVTVGEGLCNQNLTVSTISSELMLPLELNIV